MAEKGEKPKVYQQIAVLGAGSWGTALAIVAARAGREVILYARNCELAEQIRKHGHNPRYLPDISLPQSIATTARMEDLVDAQALLLAVPAQHVRAVLQNLKPKTALPIVLCAKGIERRTGLLMSEVLQKYCPRAEPAILSGPSFAHDVAAGLPTAVTIAARLPVAKRLQASLGQGAFRPYASDDLIGVSLGGAAKNVYAIGCGLSDGLGLGESARAALLTRSFAELARLGKALGARRETLMGLSGFGDLVLTATSPFSRNFAFGRALGQGRSLEELCAPQMPLAEGIDTAPALVRLSQKHDIELPIAEALALVLANRLAAGEAIVKLMTRPLKQE